MALSTQSTNTGSLKDLSGPIVLSITPNNNNSALIVEFDEVSYTNANGSGLLDTSDVTLSLEGGNAALTSNKPTSFSRDGIPWDLRLVEK